MMLTRKKCLKAGATDYLSKPIEMERLFSLFEKNLPIDRLIPSFQEKK